jgi:hypothetical protein
MHISHTGFGIRSSEKVGKRARSLVSTYLQKLSRTITRTDTNNLPQQVKKAFFTITITTMIRSIIISLFFIVLASNFAQTEGLTAIIRQVRGDGLFGIRRAQPSSTAPNVQLGAQAPSEPYTAVSPVTASFDSFDVDSYRREMTDLVYQRNMKRLLFN